MTSATARFKAALEQLLQEYDVALCDRSETAHSGDSGLIFLSTDGAIALHAEALVHRRTP